MNIVAIGLWGKLHWDNVRDYTARLNNTQVATLHQIYLELIRGDEIIHPIATDLTITGLSQSYGLDKKLIIPLLLQNQKDSICEIYNNYCQLCKYKGVI